MANRLEIFRRIIVHLSQGRIDDERRRHDQDRVSVRSGTCHGFRPDDRAGPGATFHENCLSVGAADLFGKKAPEDIGTAPGA